MMLITGRSDIMYCKENRIEGVLNINRVWLIPKTAKKPADARFKNNKNGEI